MPNLEGWTLIIMGTLMLICSIAGLLPAVRIFSNRGRKGDKSYAVTCILGVALILFLSAVLLLGIEKEAREELAQKKEQISQNESS